MGINRGKKTKGDVKMNFIRKIFEDKADNLVHNHFIRLGKGEYERAFISIKKSKKVSIKTSYEFSNDLLNLIIENAEGEIIVSGVIFSNKDEELDIEHEKSKRSKLYKYLIKSQEISKTKLKEIYEKFKDGYLLLNVNAGNCSLKCSNSLPKPGGSLKDNFCSASFNNIDVAKDFAFDVPDFKNLKIKHIYQIQELVVGNEKNDEEMRKNSKRKGKIIRILDIDGNHIEKQHDLLV